MQIRRTWLLTCDKIFPTLKLPLRPLRDEIRTSNGRVSSIGLTSRSPSPIQGDCIMRFEKCLLSTALVLAFSGILAIKNAVGSPPIPLCDTAAVMSCGCVNQGASCCYDPNDTSVLIWCSANGQTTCVVGKTLQCPNAGSTCPGTCAAPGAPVGGCTGGSFNGC